MTDLGGVVREVLGLAGIQAGSVSMIELDRSEGDEPLVAVLAFVDDVHDPVAFLKLTANGSMAAGLDGEHGNLVRLAKSLPESMRLTVPRPLFRGCVRGLDVLAETVLPGTRMKNFSEAWFRSRSFPPVFERVMDWLDRFCTTRELAGSTSAPGLAEEIVEGYRARFDRSAEADRLLDEALVSLSGARLPDVPSHGDFCVENLMVGDRGRIGVIDWEHPLDAGWPLGDLLHFVASLWCGPRGKTVAARHENHRRLFYEDHPWRSLFRKRAAAHLSELGIDPGQAIPLSVLAWAHQANRKVQTSSAAVDPPETMPRIFVVDRRCLNLELLASRTERHVFRGL